MKVQAKRSSEAASLQKLPTTINTKKTAAASLQKLLTIFCSDAAAVFFVLILQNIFKKLCLDSNQRQLPWKQGTKSLQEANCDFSNFRHNFLTNFDCQEHQIVPWVCWEIEATCWFDVWVAI
jgi:hypothetical protein